MVPTFGPVGFGCDSSRRWRYAFLASARSQGWYGLKTLGVTIFHFIYTHTQMHTLRQSITAKYRKLYWFNHKRWGPFLLTFGVSKVTQSDSRQSVWNSFAGRKTRQTVHWQASRARFRDLRCFCAQNWRLFFSCKRCLEGVSLTKG